MLDSNGRTGRGARKGLATVELAVCLPLLVYLFLVTADYGRVFYSSIIVSNCALNGANYGSVAPSNAVDQAGIRNAALADATNLVVANVTVTSSVDNSSSPRFVTVTVSYPFRTIVSYRNINSQTMITRTVRMSVIPHTPLF